MIEHAMHDGCLSQDPPVGRAAISWRILEHLAYLGTRQSAVMTHEARAAYVNQIMADSLQDDVTELETTVESTAQHACDPREVAIGPDGMRIRGYDVGEALFIWDKLRAHAVEDLEQSQGRTS